MPNDLNSLLQQILFQQLNRGANGNWGVTGQPIIPTPVGMSTQAINAGVPNRYFDFANNVFDAASGPGRAAPEERRILDWLSNNNFSPAAPGSAEAAGMVRGAGAPAAPDFAPGSTAVRNAATGGPETARASNLMMGQAGSFGGGPLRSGAERALGGFLNYAPTGEIDPDIQREAEARRPLLEYNLDRMLATMDANRGRNFGGARPADTSRNAVFMREARPLLDAEAARIAQQQSARSEEQRARQERSAGVVPGFEGQYRSGQESIAAALANLGQNQYGRTLSSSGFGREGEQAGFGNELTRQNFDLSRANQLQNFGQQDFANQQAAHAATVGNVLSTARLAQTLEDRRASDIALARDVGATPGYRAPDYRSPSVSDQINAAGGLPVGGPVGFGGGSNPVQDYINLITGGGAPLGTGGPGFTQLPPGPGTGTGPTTNYGGWVPSYTVYNGWNWNPGPDGAGPTGPPPSGPAADAAWFAAMGGGGPGAQGGPAGGVRPGVVYPEYGPNGSYIGGWTARGGWVPNVGYTGPQPRRPPFFGGNAGSPPPALPPLNTNAGNPLGPDQAVDPLEGRLGIDPAYPELMDSSGESYQGEPFEMGDGITYTPSYLSDGTFQGVSSDAGHWIPPEMIPLEMQFLIGSQGLGSGGGASLNTRNSASIARPAGYTGYIPGYGGGNAPDRIGGGSPGFQTRPPLGGTGGGGAPLASGGGGDFFRGPEYEAYLRQRMQQSIARGATPQQAYQEMMIFHQGNVGPTGASPFMPTQTSGGPDMQGFNPQTLTPEQYAQAQATAQNWRSTPAGQAAIQSYQSSRNQLANPSGPPQAPPQQPPATVGGSTGFTPISIDNGANSPFFRGSPPVTNAAGQPAYTTTQSSSLQQAAAAGNLTPQQLANIGFGGGMAPNRIGRNDPGTQTRNEQGFYGYWPRPPAAPPPSSNEDNPWDNETRTTDEQFMYDASRRGATGVLGNPPPSIINRQPGWNPGSPGGSGWRQARTRGAVSPEYEAAWNQNAQRRYNDTAGPGGGESLPGGPQQPLMAASPPPVAEQFMTGGGGPVTNTGTTTATAGTPFGQKPGIAGPALRAEYNAAVAGAGQGPASEQRRLDAQMALYRATNPPPQAIGGGWTAPWGENTPGFDPNLPMVTPQDERAVRGGWNMQNDGGMYDTSGNRVGNLRPPSAGEIGQQGVQGYSFDDQPSTVSVNGQNYNAGTGRLMNSEGGYGGGAATGYGAGGPGLNQAYGGGGQVSGGGFSAPWNESSPLERIGNSDPRLIPGTAANAESGWRMVGNAGAGDGSSTWVVDAGGNRVAQVTPPGTQTPGMGIGENDQIGRGDLTYQNGSWQPGGRTPVSLSMVGDDDGGNAPAGLFAPRASTTASAVPNMGGATRPMLSFGASTRRAGPTSTPNMGANPAAPAAPRSMFSGGGRRQASTPSMLQPRRRPPMMPAMAA